MPLEHLTDEITAREKLESLIQPNTAPTLETDEVTQLLNDCKRASLWVAATAYEIGDVIVPMLASRNGHRFVCVTAGTSGSSEPNWTTERDSCLDDGTATWREAGTDYGHVLWDLHAGACVGWKLKASKAVCKVDFETGDQAFKASQVYEHCLEQARQFAPAFIL